MAGDLLGGLYGRGVQTERTVFIRVLLRAGVATAVGLGVLRPAAPTLLGGAGSRPSHRGEPRVKRPKGRGPATQRAQQNPTAGPDSDGSCVASIAKIPAFAAIFQ